MQTHELIELALTKSAEHFGIDWREMLTTRVEGNALNARSMAVYALIGVLSRDWACEVLNISERSFYTNMRALNCNAEQLSAAKQIRREVVNLQLELTNDYYQNNLTSAA